MEKVKVIIAGVPYTVITDSEAEYTLDLATQTEAKINALVHNSRISPTQAAALTLLDYADTINRLEAENASMKMQLKDYLADAAQAKSERDMLKRELAKVKKNGGGEF